METSTGRVRLRVLAILAVLAVLLGATACGGGSSEDSQGDVLSASPSDGGSSDGDSSNPSDIDDLKDAIDQMDDGPGGDCVAAGLAFFQLALAPVGFMAGATDADIEQLRSDAEELRTEIPSEIRDDFDVYADGMEEYANAMKGADLSDIFDPETQQKFEQAGEILDSDEMQQASENIEAYFERVCPEAYGGSGS